MKKLLCRHKDKGMFSRLGFGLVIEDYGHDYILVEWLISKRNHFIMKKYLFILDENEAEGFRS